MKSILKRLLDRRKPSEPEFQPALAGVPMSDDESNNITMGQHLIMEYRPMLNGMLGDLGITQGECHYLGNGLFDVYDGEKVTMYKATWLAGDLSKLTSVEGN